MDGVSLSAVHLPPAVDDGLAIVSAHGFTGDWRNARTRNLARSLSDFGGVIAFDFRGHGRSGGSSTVGNLEVWDVVAAVTLARDLGYSKVAVVGFSMGASVAIRHAALHRGVDAVVAISGAAHWYYRGTAPMRMLHHGIERPIGRAVCRFVLGTRVDSGGWPSPPPTPESVAHKISPTPLLVVHGDCDRYFPLRHAYALHEAAGADAELWIEPGMGHAESGMTPDLTRRIGSWVSRAAR